MTHPRQFPGILVPTVALLFMACTLNGQMGRPGAESLDGAGRMTGSYARGGDIEPEISPTEFGVLEKIDAMARTDLEMARTLLEQIVSVEGRVNPVFHHALGNICFRLGDHQTAAVQLQIATERFPTFRRAWNDLGAMRFVDDDFNGAIEALARSVQLGASDSATYGMLGYCYLHTGALAAAETAYDLALLTDAGNRDWIEGKTQTLVSLERFDEAEGLLRELLRRYPENVQYWLLSANIELSQGRSLAAARNLEIARRIGEIDNEALLLLGNIYLTEDLTNRATGIYARALDQKISLPPAMSLKMAGLLLKKGETSLVRRLLDSIDTGDPTDWPIQDQVQLGMVRAGLSLVDGELEDAVERLEGILDLDPLNDRVLLRMAEIQLIRGDRENARLQLEKIDPETLDGYNAALLRARLMVEDENFEEAARILREAIRNHPGETLADYLNQVEAAADQQRLLKVPPQ